MKKHLLIIVLFMILIIPVKLFALTGSLYETADYSYKVKITNENGATVYVKGNWCPDCNNYKIYILKYGEEVNVKAEIYDYRKYIDKDCSENYCTYLSIDLGDSKFYRDENEYSRLEDEIKEYESEENKIELPKDLSYYVINSKDVELVDEINTTDKNKNNDIKKLLKYSTRPVNLYEKPSVMSNVIDTIDTDTVFDKITNSYSYTWLYVENGNKKGWVNISNTDLFYLYKSETDIIEFEEGPYRNVQLLDDVSFTRNNKAYGFPKDMVLTEFYYNTNNSDKIVAEYEGMFFAFDEIKYKKCLENSCSKNDLKVKIIEQTIISPDEPEKKIPPEQIAKLNNRERNIKISCICILASIAFLLIFAVVSNKRKKVTSMRME